MIHDEVLEEDGLGVCWHCGDLFVEEELHDGYCLACVSVEPTDAELADMMNEDDMEGLYESLAAEEYAERVLEEHQLLGLL